MFLSRKLYTVPTVRLEPATPGSQVKHSRLPLCRINRKSESFKARETFICHNFTFYGQLKISCSVQLSMNF